jgi:hypothetical protein
MPTIEVTQEQAAALARGENVTLTAPKPKRYIITFNSGNVFEVTTTQHVPTNESVRHNLVDSSTKAVLILDAVHGGRPGHVQNTISGTGVAVDVTDVNPRRLPQDVKR